MHALLTANIVLILVHLHCSLRYLH